MRFSKIFIIIAFLTAFFSCKKDPDPVTLTPNFYIVNGTVSDSAETLILFSSSDTVIYNVVISSTYYLSSNVLVTVGVSDESRVKTSPDSHKGPATMTGSVFALAPFPTTLIR